MDFFTVFSKIQKVFIFFSVLVRVDISTRHAHEGERGVHIKIT